MSTTTDSTIHLESGRRVAVTSSGPEHGPVVVLLHAAPGSRRFDPDPAVTAAAGVRLIGLDRPGYGGSDPLDPDEVPTIGRFADDVAALLDALGIAEVGVAGWSAGGRVAAALAARHPDRVRALVVAAAPAPDEVVRWIPDEHGPLIELMRADPAGSLPTLIEALGPMADLDAVGAADQVGGGSTDQAVVAGDDALRNRLDGMLAEAYRQGPMGVALDLISYCAVPWGFDPRAVGAPTTAVYGEADELVTPAHGEWWAQQIPGAELHRVAGAGHLALVPAWGRILARLAG